MNTHRGIPDVKAATATATATATTIANRGGIVCVRAQVRPYVFLPETPGVANIKAARDGGDGEGEVEDWREIGEASKGKRKGRRGSKSGGRGHGRKDEEGLAHTVCSTLTQRTHEVHAAVQGLCLTIHHFTPLYNTLQHSHTTHTCVLRTEEEDGGDPRQCTHDA